MKWGLDESDGISGQKWPLTILQGGSLTFTLRVFQLHNTRSKLQLETTLGVLVTAHNKVENISTLWLWQSTVNSYLVSTLFMGRSGSQDKFPHSIQIIFILSFERRGNWRKCQMIILLANDRYYMLQTIFFICFQLDETNGEARMGLIGQVIVSFTAQMALAHTVSPSWHICHYHRQLIVKIIVTFKSFKDYAK